ncbi:MAG: ketopantoate reductase family protein [Candidatus Binatia bacterium]
MRIAVMGAGAVGAYFGARLSASGLDVSFIARGEHLRSLQKNGLKIKSIQGDLEIYSRFTSNPEEVGPVDLILFSVKSQDTEEAGRSLAPLMSEKTTILSLQNGVDNPEKIGRLWGEDRTLTGVVYIAARVTEPGLLEHSAGGRIVLGSLVPRRQEMARKTEAILARAKIPCDVSSDIRTVLWQKLAWNAPFCALSCLLRMTVGEILASDSLKELITGCVEEVRLAAQCRGFELPSSTADETVKFSRSLGDAKPSMLQDLEAGKSLEYEALNGIVVRLLHEAGKRAPINEIFYATLKYIDHDIRAKQPTS